MSIPATDSNWNASLMALQTARTAQAAQNGGAGKDGINAAAQELEAVFISEMLSHMFEGIGVDPVFGGGKGEDVFRGMMISEYGKMISASGGIGIADHIQSFMLQVQEGTAGGDA